MMGEKIKPALTPEEWENIRAMGVDWSGYKLTRQQVAALALDGQSFGFTWEDVDALRLTVDGYQRRVRASGENAEWDGFARLRDLADRIAALLPPREP